MKKFAAAGLGAALVAATLTTTPVPAKADSPLLILGGVVAGALLLSHHYEPLKVIHPLHWKHVHWCKNRYQTYNASTNLYYYAPGLQRHCVSPYSK